MQQSDLGRCAAMRFRERAARACEHCFYWRLCSSRSDFTFSQLYCYLLLHTLFLFPTFGFILAQGLIARPAFFSLYNLGSDKRLSAVILIYFYNFVVNINVLC